MENQLPSNTLPSNKPSSPAMLGDVTLILFYGLPLTPYRIAKEIGLLNVLLFLVRDANLENVIQEFCIQAAKRITWAAKLEGEQYTNLHEFAKEAAYWSSGEEYFCPISVATAVLHGMDIAVKTAINDRFGNLTSENLALPKLTFGINDTEELHLSEILSDILNSFRIK